MKKWHFLGHEFSYKQDKQHYFKFHIGKYVASIYRMAPNMLEFLELIASLEAHSN
jgi:hypothetical protein